MVGKGKNPDFGTSFVFKAIGIALVSAGIFSKSNSWIPGSDCASGHVLSGVLSH